MGPKCRRERVSVTTHEFGREVTPADPADPDVAAMAATLDELYPGLSDDPNRTDEVHEVSYLVEDAGGQAGGIAPHREVHITNCRPPRDDGG